MRATDDAWIDQLIGQTLDGRYVVRRFIGKGGMGAVFDGEQPSLQRRVALKFLLARDEAHVQRFRREAKHASRVVHEGEPLCRCRRNPGEVPLCPAPPIQCKTSFEERSAGWETRFGFDYDDVCRDDSESKRCGDLRWMSFARRGTHGASCVGYTVKLYGLHNLRTVSEGERQEGTWECDTCPGADNQTFRGVDGLPALATTVRPARR